MSASINNENLQALRNSDTLNDSSLRDLSKIVSLEELYELINSGEYMLDNPDELVQHFDDERLASLIENLDLHDYMSLDLLCEKLTGKYLYKALRETRFLNMEADADMLADLFEGNVLLESLQSTHLITECGPDWIVDRFSGGDNDVLRRALILSENIPGLSVRWLCEHEKLADLDNMSLMEIVRHTDEFVKGDVHVNLLRSRGLA